MWEKVVNCFECLDSYVPTFVAVLLTILIVIVGIGVGFGISLGMAWVTMMVYNVLASTFNWPVFSIWFWLGALYVFGWIRKGFITVGVKKGE